MGQASRRKRSTRGHQRASRARGAAGPTLTRLAPWPEHWPWISLSLVLVCLVIYAAVWTYSFINSDDPVYVTGNPTVLGGLSWSNVWWAFTTDHPPYWHPLTWLSHMTDVQLFGANAGGHHLSSVLLHAANSVLLFLVLARITGARGRSMVVAGMFAVHPLRVESVAWVAERKDVLSTLFWIATTWAYVEYTRRPRLARYLGVLALFGLGLMSKPMLVTLPATLLLLDYWPLARLRREDSGGPIHAWWPLVREKLPLFALAAAASILTLGFGRSVGAVNALEAIPFSARLQNAVLSYGLYIRDLFWPLQASAIYPYPRSFSALQVGAVLLLLLVVTGLALRWARTRPWLPVGWLWFLGTLLPVIGLIQVGPQGRADRFTYVPYIGLFLMLAWGVPDALRRWSHARKVLIPVASVLLIACAGVARQQLTYWKSSRSLWERALNVTTQNEVAHYNLALVLLGTAENDDAIAHLREAVRIEPQFAFAHNRLAIALAEQGDHEGAAFHFLQVVQLLPQDSEAHDNVGIALVRQGKAAEALTHFEEALRLDPANGKAREHLEYLRRGGGG